MLFSLREVLNLQSSDQILRNLQTEWLKTIEPQQNKKNLDLKQDNYKIRKFWKVRVLK